MHLRLLYAIESIGSPGGSEQSLAALAPHYRRLGVELHVAVLYDRPGFQDDLLAAGAQLHSVVGGGGRIGWTYRLRDLIRRLRPDLVHTTLFEADIAGRLAARLAGVPVVTSLVNVTYGAEHQADSTAAGWRLQAARLLDSSTARLAVRMHAVSEHVADVMAPRLWYPRSRIDVVPRGRDPETLGRRTPERREAARAGLDASATTQIVLAVARQEHQKGLDVLLAALPTVRDACPNVRLVVAGREGGHTEALLALVHKLGLGDVVSFLGTRADVPDLLCAADVLALPSRREGLPGTVLEAMALETPVVASDLPQVRELVDETCPRLVPVESAAYLARAVIEVLMQPDAAEARAVRAREIFLQRFAVANVAEAMMGFYRTALGAH